MFQFIWNVFSVPLLGSKELALFTLVFSSFYVFCCALKKTVSEQRCVHYNNLSTFRSSRRDLFKSLRHASVCSSHRWLFLPWWEPSHFKLPVWWHWEGPLIKTFVSLLEAFRSVNGTWHRRQKRICPNQSSPTWREEDACGPGRSLMNPPLSLDFWGACASTRAPG